MTLTGAYQIMLDEIEGQHLIVVLFPAPRPAFEGHMIRVPIERNPAWYRRLQADCGYRLRRGEVVRVLRRLASGQSSSAHCVVALTCDAVAVRKDILARTHATPQAARAPREWACRKGLI